jgi:hypothetical protein
VGDGDYGNPIGVESVNDSKPESGYQGFPMTAVDRNKL